MEYYCREYGYPEGCYYKKGNNMNDQTNQQMVEAHAELQQEQKAGEGLAANVPYPEGKEGEAEAEATPDGQATAQ